MKNTPPSSVSFPEIEADILKRWGQEKTFQQSRIKNKGRSPYIFYDGPPFATGLPHYGHILTSYAKDTVPRYFNMKGFYVDRRWGWDCHGLPVEYEVEKKLGLSGKKSINRYGVEKFNEQCRNIVLTYAEDWENIINRIGRWVDFERQYKTMDLDYMESVVWVFGELYKKGLVYESSKVVAYCNRCQTPLSNHETGLDDAYREKEDTAAYVKFTDTENSLINYLAWTTTPWTLPANVALAVNEDLQYALIQFQSKEMFWVAQDSLSENSASAEAYEVVQTCEGKALLERTYFPVFEYNQSQEVYRIISGDFVTSKPGTGIVHIAPSFGEDDWTICQRENIAEFDPVDENGKFTAAVPDFCGMDVFESNEPIIEHLKSLGRLFRQERYSHSYPHCWRCDHPLIYRTISSWYVAVSRIKRDLLRLNQNINWVPGHIRDGRFGKWLEGARDWAISRNRFWGTPVPVWRCTACDDIYIPSSIRDLEAISNTKIKDFHRPFCDLIQWPCPGSNCEGQMKRTSEVLDCWFESGAMPYAQEHFPFENKAHFENNFPASFIVEYTAQTRGWFYTLMVLATAVMGSHPSENAVCHGVILAEDGRKMSKSLKNYPDPMNVINEYGSDALRIYLLSSPVIRGTDIRLSEADVREAVRRYLIPLWNVFHFYTAYSEHLEDYRPSLIEHAVRIEDRHILSELEIFKSNIEKSMETYHLPRCYQNILAFLQMLSAWYIRVNRRRFWVTELDEDSRQAFETLYTVLIDLIRICAPFLPFTTDFIHRHLVGTSVHLEGWPAKKQNRINVDLCNDMKTVQLIVEGIRAVREKNATGLRQPLPKVRISGVAENKLRPFEKLIKEQGNVKKVLLHNKPEDFLEPRIRLDSKTLGPLLKKDFNTLKKLVSVGQFEILLDGRLQSGAIIIDPESFEIEWRSKYKNEDSWQSSSVLLSLSFKLSEDLLIEKTANDLNRLIQDLRKKQKLPYNQHIHLKISASGKWLQALSVYRDYIVEQSLSNGLSYDVKNPMIRKDGGRGKLEIEIVPG